MKAYLLITGFIFAAVAVVHAARLIQGWEVRIGSFEMPMMISVVAAIVPAALSAWALTMARKR